jgi:hypothetical protein
MMPSGVSRPDQWLDRPRAQVEASTSRLGVLATAAPVAAGELVLDQAVLRRRVGHAQKRLREHHQRQPFPRGQRVSAGSLEPADHPEWPRIASIP